MPLRCRLLGHKMANWRAQKGAANGGKPLFWYSFCERQGCGHAETCQPNRFDNGPDFSTIDRSTEGR